MDRPPPGTIKQGYLTKSPPLEKKGLKAWKKRWCIFTILGNTEEPSLKYFKNEEDSFYAPTPIKRVSLRHCFKIEVDLQHANHKNIFALHLPDRIYYFSAPSRMEMNEWAESLCTNLRLHNPKYGERKTLPVTPPVNRAVTERAVTLPRDVSLYDTTQHPSHRPEVSMPHFLDTMYSSYHSSRPDPSLIPSLGNMYTTHGSLPASDNMYGSSRPRPPEIPLPPVPRETLMSTSLPLPPPPISDNMYASSRPRPPEIPLPLPPPPEIPLPPVPSEGQCSSLPRSSSPLLRHQRAPSPFSDEGPPLPPRQSLSPPYHDDIANRPPAPLPHAPRASPRTSRQPGTNVPPPLPPARNESTGGLCSSPPHSLNEPVEQEVTPPTPPPRQEVPQLSRMSSRAENNIYVTT